MFTIITKNKAITLDFFTDDYTIYDLFKIEKTIKCKPNWLTNDLAIKFCPGLHDFMKQSFCIKSWTDIVIEKNQYKEISVASSHPCNKISGNPPEERGSFLPPQNYQHMKIEMPWVCRTKKSFPVAFYGAAWHNEKFLNEFQNLPSIRDLHYSPNWNIHYIINKSFINNNDRINLYTGEILQYILPLTENRVKVRSHYDPDMVKKIKSEKPGFFSMHKRAYYRLKKIKKNK